MLEIQDDMDSRDQVKEVRLSELQRMSGKSDLPCRYVWPWLLAGLLPTNGQQTDIFLRDLMPSLPSTKPAIIMDPDKHSIWEWAGHYLTTAIDAERDAATIVNLLNEMIEEELTDLIFFLEPLPAKLILDVTSSLKNISLRKVNVFIPHGEAHGLNLRLDTRLYMYNVGVGWNLEFMEGVTLFESYNIRQVNYRSVDRL